MKKFLYIILVAMMASLPGCDSLMELINPTEENQEPTLLVKVEDTTPEIGSTQQLSAEVYDPDGEDTEIKVDWTVTGGELSQTHGLTVEWTAPDDTSTVEITATATDSKDAAVSKTVIMNVGNEPPVITSFTSSSMNVVSGNAVTLACVATDPEGGELTYEFEVIGGSGVLDHKNDQADSAIWVSPSNSFPGETIELVVHVYDPLRFTATDTVEILVYSNYGSLWVVDGEHKILSKYTSNGHKIFTSPQTFTSPEAVIGAVDELGGCFVADKGADAVYKIDFNGNTLSSYEDIPHVIDIALHHSTQKLWALSYVDGSITIIDQRTGDVEKTITGFYEPTKIDINQFTGDVWVLEEGNNRLINLNIASDLFSLTDTTSVDTAVILDSYFNGPASIYINHPSNSTISQLYVADTFDNQLERFVLEDGLYEHKAPITPLSTLPRLMGVLNVNLKDMLMIISSTGNVELMEVDNQVNKYAVSGNYQFIKPQVLKVDHLTNECWIGDNGTNQLVKIKINSDYSFTVLRKLDGFLSIRDLTINR